jgi:hypothetical protein
MISTAATGQLPASASSGTAAIWTTYPLIVIGQYRPVRPGASCRFACSRSGERKAKLPDDTPWVVDHGRSPRVATAQPPGALV